MAYKHSSEVVKAVKTTGLEEVVTYQTKLDIWPKLQSTYTGSEYRYPLWEHIKKWIAITYPFAWEMFEEMLSGKEAILFLEPDENDGCFFFEDGKDLVPVLEECYAFTFYITDSNASFLLAYNDHEYLITAGASQEWLLNSTRMRDLNLKVWTSDISST